MGPSIREIGPMIRLRGLASIPGQMVESIAVIGDKTSFMEKDSIHGAAKSIEGSTSLM